jgi:hypothetical protein
MYSGSLLPDLDFRKVLLKMLSCCHIKIWHFVWVLRFPLIRIPLFRILWKSSLQPFYPFYLKYFRKYRIFGNLILYFCFDFRIWTRRREFILGIKYLFNIFIFTFILWMCQSQRYVRRNGINNRSRPDLWYIIIVLCGENPGINIVCIKEGYFTRWTCVLVYWTLLNEF